MILRWQLDPILIGGLVTMALMFGLAVGPLRKRIAPTEAFPRGKTLLFYLTLVILYLAEGSPLHDLAEIYLFSAHMVQHLILSYVVPPLLITSLPLWLLRPLLLNRFVYPIARVLTKPLVALLVFSFGLSLWHFSAIYEAQLRSSLVHHSEHVVFIAIALIMWWPILGPLPELPRPGYGMRMMYLLLLPVGQVLVSAFLTLASSPFYPTYINAPRITGLDPLADQQLGGIIMKVSGFIVFGIPLVWTFFRWYQEENAPKPTRAAPSVRQPD